MYRIVTNSVNVSQQTSPFKPQLNQQIPFFWNFYYN